MTISGRTNKFDGRKADMKKELTVAQATRRLGVTMDAVYRLLYAGKLEARKSDGRWFISEQAVETRLKGRKL
jgi:excisionase family DNA binding protein